MTSVHISFTGAAKRLTESERGVIRSTIGALGGEPALFFSGAAKGVDVYAALQAMHTFPHAKHVVLIPCWRGPSPKIQLCKHDAAGVEGLARAAESIGCEVVIRSAPAGVGDEATGLLRRNDVLAVNCTHMVAFPKTPVEQQRSGTWATVRRARKLGRPVLVVPLNGDAPVRL